MLYISGTFLGVAFSSIFIVKEIVVFFLTTYVFEFSQSLFLIATFVLLFFSINLEQPGPPPDLSFLRGRPRGSGHSRLYLKYQPGYFVLMYSARSNIYLGKKLLSTGIFLWQYLEKNVSQDYKIQNIILNLVGFRSLLMLV